MPYRCRLRLEDLRSHVVVVVTGGTGRGDRRWREDCRAAPREHPAPAAGDAARLRRVRGRVGGAPGRAEGREADRMWEVTGILHAPEQVCSVLEPIMFNIRARQKKNLNPTHLGLEQDRHDVVVWLWFRITPTPQT
jgi:hypothetical protein